MEVELERQLDHREQCASLLEVSMTPYVAVWGGSG